MTQCIGIPAEEMAEKYLAGGLTDTQSEEFENHYFECESCHEHVVALQQVREMLLREPIAIPSPVSKPVIRNRGIWGRLLAFPVPVAVLGSVAAALIFGAVLVGVQRSGYFLPRNHGGNAAAKTVQPAQVPGSVQASAASQTPLSAKTGEDRATVAENVELASLADLRIPGYEQPQLRGESLADSDHLAFTAGMTGYTKQDCAEAVNNLKKVDESAADGVAARLYSGLCQLQERETQMAQASFATVVAAGDTPQLETAEYFLAQARLVSGDVAGARKWLNRTIALHGDYEERALAQRARLAHAKPDHAKEMAH